MKQKEQKEKKKGAHAAEADSSTGETDHHCMTLQLFSNSRLAGLFNDSDYSMMA